jgi:hypothetical protein
VGIDHPESYDVTTGLATYVASNAIKKTVAVMSDVFVRLLLGRTFVVFAVSIAWGLSSVYRLFAVIAFGSFGKNRK